MSDDFELAVYIKSDKKPMAVYFAYLLIINYEEFTDPTNTPPASDYNLAVQEVTITPSGVTTIFGEEFFISGKQLILP